MIWRQKYNEGDKYFDEDDSRYLIPAIEAMETLIKKGVIFEISPHFAYDKVRTELTPNRNLITAIKKLRRKCDNRKRRR
ncbi:MAG: hypothetical protein L6V93_03025 [Clostridiales bacterium]|nr:MAG: hypothetical protein L6V93_03025 [Clostridiales bacterium]